MVTTDPDAGFGHAAGSVITSMIWRLQRGNDDGGPTVLVHGQERARLVEHRACVPPANVDRTTVPYLHGGRGVDDDVRVVTHGLGGAQHIRGVERKGICDGER